MICKIANKYLTFKPLKMNLRLTDVKRAEEFLELINDLEQKWDLWWFAQNSSNLIVWRLYKNSLIKIKYKNTSPYCEIYYYKNTKTLEKYRKKFNKQNIKNIKEKLESIQNNFKFSFYFIYFYS